MFIYSEDVFLAILHNLGSSEQVFLITRSFTDIWSIFLTFEILRLWKVVTFDTWLLHSKNVFDHFVVLALKGLKSRRRRKNL